MSDGRIKEFLKVLTIDEKLSLLRGANFWETVSIPRLGLPALVLNDGPFGIRKPQDSSGAGINETTLPATSFPTTSALASSFDEELLFKIGETLASECIDQGVDILLGPGLNIKRSPLCGRNFEYFSEDPCVSATLASALINGLQKHGVGATIKHYAVNSQENERFTTNAIVDKRALNEIYLKPFHKIIERSSPWAVMCSYNQVNGRHASRNEQLLTKELRQNARFNGLVVSDWGAVINLVDSVNAGLNLEMPGGESDTSELKEAIAKGRLSIQKIDEVITPLLHLMIQKKDNEKQRIKADYMANFKTAQEIAENSAVLLKNDDLILPLNEKTSVALIGNFSKNPRYQGSGSSKVSPFKLVSLYDTFVDQKISFDYADGYLELEEQPNAKLIAEAVRIARHKDVVIISAGLPESFEAEGYDRSMLDMPPSHNELISAISDVNPNVVVVLSNGSPVTMPWLNKVKGVLLCHLMGGAVGPATFNLLYGHSNPSGKLAETYPVSIEASLPGKSYLEDSQNVPYKESLYVGYRYFDSFNKEVLFPFGYGLSYTKFKTSPLSFHEDKDRYEVILSVENLGHIAGSEVVALYIGKNESLLFRPKKELRVFKKVHLQPYEVKEVKLTFSKKELEVFDPIKDKWIVENGKYIVFVGLNVESSLETYSFDINGEDAYDHLRDYKILNEAYYNHEQFKINVQAFKKLYSEPLPLVFPNRKRPFTLENSIADTTDYLMGRMISKMMIKMARKMASGDQVMEQMAVESSKRMPFRTIPALSSGEVTLRQMEALLLILNGKIIRGGIKYLKREKKNKRKVSSTHNVV